ncbi:Kinesin-like protein NACK1 [Dendrobium catenatum]|uniref:Kinesin-like protein n=1 Tax=Dendrobium catenatum TaxID=906689 RepID=A0A2I0XCQ7_9ASPA|nr:Kinesin-like protein NACK1 [Dendrobium catenatum]
MGSSNGDDAGNGGAGGGKEERIYVSVRVRPLSSKEIERKDPSDWEVINNTTIIFKNNLPDRSMSPSAYTYDRVFDYNCDTRKVYEEGAKEIALSVLSGINSSIFAYGQTSSGKTYTMNGIAEYFVEDIYDYMEKHEEREFLLKFSAMEIYNEAVRDLLSSDNSHLRLLDDPERGTIVEKLTEETLRDESHLKELLAICEAQRQIGETTLNEASSRSHQILRLTIESSAREFRASSLAATVNFVDLAGSERASQTLSAGTRLKEGSHINRSLLTLGTVIRKLSNGRNAHVPYRDSKLTRILQNSLGGNARTAIICTMSPARSHIEQTRNTLLFASCAKEVATSARVNVVMSDKALVKHLQRELARLEDELRYVGSIHKTTNTDELKVKDEQIVKMGKEIKLLIQQRDLGQAQLDNLLRSIGDDQASRRLEETRGLSMRHIRNPFDDVHSSRHWDESSQLSVYRAGTSEDESLTSEASGICYQSPEFGISKCRIPHSNNYYEANLQSSAITRLSETSVGIERYIAQNASRAPEIASETSEDHCKEVQCIEMNDLNVNKDEFSLLLDEDCDNLIPTSFVAKAKAAQSLKHQVGVRRACKNLVKPDIDEPTLWPFGEDFPSFRSSSPSTNLRGKPGPCSDYFGRQNLEENNNAPYSSAKKLLIRPEDASTGNSSISCGSETEALFGLFKKSEFFSDEEVKFKDFKVPEKLPKLQHTRNCEDKLRAKHCKTPSEVDIPSISNFVEGMKEMAQVQCQKQLSKKREMHDTSFDNYMFEKTARDSSTGLLIRCTESPSQWPLEFEKLQREIIELWDACIVSLIHRTYFFLLFKGEPADSIYMEVERRRLSFLKKMISQDNGNDTLSSSIKNLRRERDMLHKRMLKKLSKEEREALYRKWGIKLASKQRRMQLARLLWTNTMDMEQIRESALLVAKLIGLLEPEQALKEMFGLSFTPHKTHRRSSSWKQISSFR